MNQQFYMLSEEGIKVLAKQITENIKKAINPSETSSDDAFMTIDETAKLIKLAKSSIYGLVHQKKIPFNKVGKKLYFSKSDILQWISAGKNATKSEIELKADEYLIKNQLFNR
ncbi:helix-turn-helix domain-containing protein [Flavobacterium sp. SUN052]|uniref:helix-turn-helix domain-containing protein n=1 Tax=Flavobacterium sp. SUN052 TaxID=3002441 RepID=UPI00237EC9B1|nr:helix-turn-helix domain-containing protein [Flavobacterium sp. SUN052]MEC4005882.1 helix-turn-helix domain-containing protein [Flavobacterium sp. SUN052]